MLVGLPRLGKGGKRAVLVGLPFRSFPIVYDSPYGNEFHELRFLRLAPRPKVSKSPAPSGRSLVPVNMSGSLKQLGNPKVSAGRLFVFNPLPWNDDAARRPKKAVSEYMGQLTIASQIPSRTSKISTRYRGRLTRSPPLPFTGEFHETGDHACYGNRAELNASSISPRPNRIANPISPSASHA